jgi:asparagine synthase (glutamine-hydrolysing)
MCGIVGYSLAVRGGIGMEMLVSARDAIAHRGPDDTGLFEDVAHGIGMAHTRLSILDPSPLGHQPMLSEDNRVVLSFNGEIYNFRELRAELIAKGRVFRGNSDTEVLLHLYLDCRASGGDVADTLRRLNGIFALALWDADRGELLLARDALGVKPLYYCAEGGIFAFASEIKALLPLIGNVGPLDAAAVHRYLSFLWCPGNSTPTSNVKKLGPGELMLVREGVIVESEAWYRLPVFSNVASHMNEAETVSGVVQHLRTAVHRQLVADVPVGAFLSGGLDSSSVVAFAKERNPDIRCFTVDVEGGAEAGATDDLPYARRVAKYLNVPLEVVRVDAVRMAEDLAEMVAQLDEPLADPAPLNVLYISRLARECGIKVLLSGTGGDDLFTGYRRHSAVLVERYWSWLGRPIRQVLSSVTTNLDQRIAPGRRLRKLFDGALMEGDERNDLWALYTPEFRAAVGDVEAGAPMLHFLSGLPTVTAPLERMLALEQRFFLADHNLIYTDKMSMAAGVEVRVPFLDLDLVEFAQRISIQLKQRNNAGKWVLKKAMEPYLPKDVIYRPKSGFGAPLRRWMRFELRELLGDVLSDTSLRRRGLFDPMAVQKLISANDMGRIDASYTLLSLLCVELWCRRFIDVSEKSELALL